MKFTLIPISALLTAVVSRMHCDFYTEPKLNGRVMPAWIERPGDCDNNFHNVYNDIAKSANCYKTEQGAMVLELFEDAYCEGDRMTAWTYEDGRQTTYNFPTWWHNKISSWKYSYPERSLNNTMT
jgi:hypothetical protein